MASCLGISVGKNLIKYAKMSKDKATNSIRIDAYGVKFYDVLAQTVSDIIQETKSADASVAVTITSEDYAKTQVFKSIKAGKERDQFLQSDFDEMCTKKNVNPSTLDARFILAEDVENPEQYKVLCMAASKVELSNLWQALQATKFESITAIGSTITNLFKENGLGQNCLIVNIEDTTKLTIVKNGHIYEMFNVHVGMDEVISKLAEKYNSYAKAYEACKGVDAYADKEYDLTDADDNDEAQSVRDILMPCLYDLKQRIMLELQPYFGDFQDVYITGTGVIVNNIDLYLAEAFPGKRIELLVPYFVNKDRNSLKDVLEVNSALATAIYCLNGITKEQKEQDFLAAGNYLKKQVNKKNLTPKVLFATVQEKLEEINKKTLKPRRSSKKKNKKKSIEFDGELENLQQVGGSGEFNAPGFEEEEEYYDPQAEWLVRVACSLFVAWIAYTGFAHVISQNIDKKLALVNENIAKSNAAIEQVERDRDTIIKQAGEYRDKKVKLQNIIETIRLRKEATYQVPNFMSQLMFIIPTDVKVNSITVGNNNAVMLEADSPKYAQLGYFVSRLKLAGIMKDVEMEVVDMSSDIKIKVNGVLP